MKAVRPAEVFSDFAQTSTDLDRLLDRSFNDYSVVILKFHRSSERVFELLANGKARNVFTFRHPLAAVASARDFFGLDLAIALGSARDSLVDMDRYREIPGSIFISMRNIVKSTKKQTYRLSKHLGFTLESDAIQDVAEATSTARMREFANALAAAPEHALIDIGFSRYDKDTHVHVGHIQRALGRDYRQHLSDEELKICKVALAPWLRRSSSW